MKKNIHPTYYKDATTTCSCGNVMHIGSTVKDLKTELCSACHPFYTGKQKLVDTAGRVDKFMAKMKKAEDIKTEKENTREKQKETKVKARKASTKSKKAKK